MNVPVKLSGEFYGTKEAAEALDRTESRIRQMIRSGELDAIEMSERVWLVPKKEIDRILRQRNGRRS